MAHPVARSTRCLPGLVGRTLAADYLYRAFLFTDGQSSKSLCFIDEARLPNSQRPVVGGV